MSRWTRQQRSWTCPADRSNATTTHGSLMANCPLRTRITGSGSSLLALKAKHPDRKLISDKQFARWMDGENMMASNARACADVLIGIEPSRGQQHQCFIDCYGPTPSQDRKTPAARLASSKVKEARAALRKMLFPRLFNYSVEIPSQSLSPRDPAASVPLLVDMNHATEPVEDLTFHAEIALKRVVFTVDCDTCRPLSWLSGDRGRSVHRWLWRVSTSTVTSTSCPRPARIVINRSIVNRPKFALRIHEKSTTSTRAPAGSHLSLLAGRHPFIVIAGLVPAIPTCAIVRVFAGNGSVRAAGRPPEHVWR